MYPCLGANMEIQGRTNVLVRGKIVGDSFSTAKVYPARVHAVDGVDPARPYVYYTSRILRDLGLWHMRSCSTCIMNSRTTFRPAGAP